MMSETQLPLPMDLPSRPMDTAAAETDRLRRQERVLANGQRIILGGLLLKAARQDPHLRRWLLDEAARVTRERDRKRLAPLLDELANLPAAEDGL